eukprot:superscaffoldBa00000602_g5993
MKLLIAGIVLILIVESNAQWYKFPVEAAQGAHDMWRAYSDMREANWKNSDKYFHARGNYDAAQRGAGGRWASEVIRNFKTSKTMKLLIAGIVLILIVESYAQWYKFPVEAAQGARDMHRAYRDMKEANWKNSDKYFHARGNHDAAQRGAGGRWAARVISCSVLQCELDLRDQYKPQGCHRLEQTVELLCLPTDINLLLGTEQADIATLSPWELLNLPGCPLSLAILAEKQTVKAGNEKRE